MLHDGQPSFASQLPSLNNDGSKKDSGCEPQSASRYGASYDAGSGVGASAVPVVAVAGASAPVAVVAPQLEEFNVGSENRGKSNWVQDASGHLLLLSRGADTASHGMPSEPRPAAGWAAAAAARRAHRARVVRVQKPSSASSSDDDEGTAVKRSDGEAHHPSCVQDQIGWCGGGKCILPETDDPADELTHKAGINVCPDSVAVVRARDVTAAPQASDFGSLRSDGESAGQAAGLNPKYISPPPGRAVISPLVARPNATGGVKSSGIGADDCDIVAGSSGSDRPSDENCEVGVGDPSSSREGSSDEIKEQASRTYPSSSAGHEEIFVDSVVLLTGKASCVSVTNAALVVACVGSKHPTGTFIDATVSTTPTSATAVKPDVALADDLVQDAKRQRSPSPLSSGESGGREKSQSQPIDRPPRQRHKQGVISSGPGHVSTGRVPRAPERSCRLP
jgi:hypothetical protein